MSVCCRATDRQKGFTLIELLVTLTIIAAIAALVAPASLSGLTRGAVTERRLAVERVLVGLPDAARNANRTLWLDSNSAILTLPIGWRVEPLEGPIRYRFDGICAGGRIRVIGEGTAWTYTLAPPYCTPVRE
jgi:prepilin-type N-terminal cleavage/methylation domain-containing protein